MKPLRGLGDRAAYWAATYNSEPVTLVDAMKGTRYVEVEGDGLDLSSLPRIEHLTTRLLASG